MALRIPVLLIALLTLPTLAAEHPVSAPVVQPASWLPLRYSPSIAFGSSTILIVWNEQFSDIYPEANAQVMARLFRKDGTLLRDVQFPLGFGIRPRAAWNGSEYLIAYVIPTSRFGTFPQPLLGMIRVTEDGEIDSSIRFAPFGYTPDIGAFAFNSDRAMLIVNGGAYVMNRDGNVIATKPEIAGDVIAFGDGFAEAAISRGFLYVRTYTRDGDLRAMIPVDYASSARIGAHGDQLAVLWSSGTRILATTIDQGAAAATVTLANVVDPRAGSVTWGGDAWMSVWRSGSYDSPRACASRFLGNTIPISVCSLTASHDPVIASDGATVATSWIDGVISSSFINPNKTLASFAGAGHVPEFDRGRVISEAARPQHLLAAAEAPGGTWIVWNESFPDRDRVFIGGFTSEGQALLPVQLPITRAVEAQLVAGNQTMLLVWTSGPFANIYASRLDAGGNLLDFPIELGVGRDPRAAFDGHEWLVVFESSDPNDTAHTQIVASTIDENGTATFGVPIESNLQVRQYSPRIAWTGSKFLVTWYVLPPLENTVATARLVDAHGNVVSHTLQFTDRGVDSVACGPSSCVMTSDRKVGYVTTSLLQIGPVLPIPINGVARSLGDDSFAIDAFTPNGLIETVVDKGANVVGTRRLLDVNASGIVLPSRIVYERTTRAGEPYGGSL